MSHKAGIVQNLKALVKNEQLPTGTDPAQQAQEYAGLCRVANERLRLCREYLKKGMRSEALHVAESEPALLDLCAELDFVGADRWRRLCAEKSWTVPDALDAGAIDALNEAYSAGMKLEPLLHEYRRVVRRGTTRDCVQILRRLMALDPANRNWLEDLSGFEKKRLGEIRDEVRDAVAGGNGARLEELLGELQEKWSIHGPETLASEIRGHVDGFRRKEAFRHGQAVVESLGAAYSRLDYARTQAALQAYQRLLQGGYFLPSAEMRTQYEEAAEWHAQEQKAREEEARFQETLAQIRGELEKETPGKELARLWNVAGAFGKPIPEETERRVLLLIENMALAEKRRRTMQVLVAAAAVAVLLGAVVAVLWHKNTQRLIALWDVELGSLAKQGDITRFKAVLADLQRQRPRVFEAPQVRQWAAKCSQLEHDEAVRQESLTSTLARLDAIRADGFTEKAELVDALLKSAAGKARTPVEKARTLELMAECEGHRAAQQGDRDKQVRTALEQLATLFQRCGGFSTSTLSSIREQLPPIVRLIADAEKVDSAAAELKAQVREYRGRLTELEQGVTERDQLLADLTTAHSLKAFYAALDKYATVFKDDVLSARMSGLAALRPDAEALTALPLPESMNPDTFFSGDMLAFQTRCGESNSFWSRSAGDLCTHHESMKRLWPGIRREVLEWGESSLFTALRRFDFRAIQSGRQQSGFVRGDFAEEPERATGEGASRRGDVYFPRAVDTQPEFKPLIFYERNCQISNVELLPHCGYIKSLCKDLPLASVDSGMAPDELLLKLMSDLAGQDNIYPLLRVRFLGFLMERFAVCAKTGPSNGMQAVTDIQVRTASIDGEVPWLCTERADVKAANQQAAKVIAACWGSQAVFAQYRYALMLRRAALSRGICWVGHASVEETPAVVWGKDQPEARPKEVFVLRRSGSAPGLVSLEAEECQSGWRSNALLPGEAVFAPTDGQTTRGLLERLRKRAGTEPSGLTEWPVGWPANRRGHAR